MTILSYRPDFRGLTACCLMYTVFLLSACDTSSLKSASHDVSQADSKLLFSATLSYEDRLMMRDYLFRELCNGLVVIAEMQVLIDNNPE